MICVRYRAGYHLRDKFADSAQLSRSPPQKPQRSIRVRLGEDKIYYKYFDVIISIDSSWSTQRTMTSSFACSSPLSQDSPQNRNCRQVDNGLSVFYLTVQSTRSQTLLLQGNKTLQLTRLCIQRMTSSGWGYKARGINKYMCFPK